MHRVLAHLLFATLVVIGVAQIALTQDNVVPADSGPAVTDSALDVAQWEKFRPQLRKQAWEALATDPIREPEIKFSERREEGGLARFDVTLNTNQDHVTARMLLAADQQGRRPAIVVPRTSTEGNPSTLTDELLAEHFVSQGYVVLAVESAAPGRTDRSALAQSVRGDLLAVRMLLKRKEVDHERIGVVGYGEEATRALYMAAMEDRVSAMVQIDPQPFPRDTFDSPELAEKLSVLIAPRAWLSVRNGGEVKPVSVAPANDDAASARQIYRLYEMSDLFRDVSSTAGSAAMWQSAREWLLDEL